MARTAPPPKLTNLEQRTREHLLAEKVEAMLKAAKVIRLVRNIKLGKEKW